MVLEKTLEGPLDCKEIQPVHSKGDQSWVFIGRTDAKTETPILWPLHVKSWLTGKDPDAGRDWGQEEKGTTEDEMAGWHHRLDGHEFEWTLGVGDGQGGLSDWTELRSHWNTDIISPFDRLSDIFAPFIAHKNLKQNKTLQLYSLLQTTGFFMLSNLNYSYGVDSTIIPFKASLWAGQHPKCSSLKNHPKYQLNT